ncbi:hypothetical protein V6N13_014888 [Hibiscus sabdariffa]|uniref:Uncharacterized protein n=1 Tax=Hibiscus sabdariffa TaxID=183260 RepID=A0ABR1ZXN1_9ROSI
MGRVSSCFSAPSPEATKILIERKNRTHTSNGNLCLSSYRSKLGHTKEGKLAILTVAARWPAIPLSERRLVTYMRWKSSAALSSSETCLTDLKQLVISACLNAC